MKILLGLLLATSMTANASMVSVYKDWKVTLKRESNIVIAESFSKKFSNSFMLISFSPDRSCRPAISMVLVSSGNSVSDDTNGAEAKQTWRIDNSESFDITSMLEQEYLPENNRTMQTNTFQLDEPVYGSEDLRFLTEMMVGTTLRTAITTVADTMQYDRFSLLGSHAALSESIDMCLDLKDSDKDYFKDNDAKYFRS